MVEHSYWVAAEVILDKQAVSTMSDQDSIRVAKMLVTGIPCKSEFMLAAVEKKIWV